MSNTQKRQYVVEQWDIGAGYTVLDTHPPAGADAVVADYLREEQATHLAALLNSRLALMDAAQDIIDAMLPLDNSVIRAGVHLGLFWTYGNRICRFKAVLDATRAQR